MILSVEDVLDDHVATLEEERFPDGFWHPSGMFGCARKAVYEFTGAAKAPLDKRTKRIFRIGHILHEFLQTALTRSPKVVTFYAEVSVTDPERGIKGHADGLGLLEDGTWMVLEAKSIGGFGFKALNGTKEDHEKQAKTYVRILRKFGGHIDLTEDEAQALDDDTNLETLIEDEQVIYRLHLLPMPNLVDIKFAYMEKDSLTVKEYDATYTAEDERSLEEYFDRLSLHVYEGTLPRRLVQITPTGRVSKTRAWECKFCPFQEQCWSPREPDGIN